MLKLRHVLAYLLTLLILAASPISISSGANKGSISTQASGAFTVTIAGRVKDSNGNGISDATVSVSGTLNYNCSINSTGNYTCPYLWVGGTYTITATKGGYTFTPANYYFPDWYWDVLGADFVGQ